MAGKKSVNKEMEGDGEGFISMHVSSHIKRSIAAIFLFVIAVIFVLGFFNAAGPLGVKMSHGLGMIFGWGKYVSPFVFAFTGIVLLRNKVQTQFYVTKIIGIALSFWGLLALLHLIPYDSESYMKIAQDGSGGGMLGMVLADLLVKFAGKIAGAIILLAVILVGLVIAFNMSLVGLGDHMPSISRENLLLRRKKRDIQSDEDDVMPQDDIADVVEEDPEEFDDFDDEESDEELEMTETVADEPQMDQHVTYAQKVDAIMAQKTTNEKRMRQRNDVEWQLPPLKLLKSGGEKAQGGDVKVKAQRIMETFANFGIAMELEDVVTGPTVTQYSFRPQSGVKLSRITALNADLALALAAHPIRIEAPIPGKSLVGIEVPNKTPATVRMRDLLNTDEFDQPDKKLLLALGEDVNGDYVFENLSKMPHLLVAGTTGSGKSVTINCILLSLLYKNSPDDLKLILVDPKRVELTLYSGIPHLLSEVIVDNGKVINALKWAVSEMERRYKLLQETGSRDLESYNQKREAGEMHVFIDPATGNQCTEPIENLPAIVIVIDELSDLMSSHGKEVEGVIVRIAQMSRAIGIHLIISTQRPSVEVITGLIKANLPTRIALRVATNIDSRTIIDVPGAEKLVGNGDMLFVGPQSSSPRRLQSAFVEEEEVKKVVQFIRRQAESAGVYDIEESFDGDSSGASSSYGGGMMGSPVDFNDGGNYSGSEDSMYEDAKQAVIEAGKASTSYIQRRLRVGYSRAARLMDDLEKNGVIGPQEGSRPRHVLISRDGEPKNVASEDE